MTPLHFDYPISVAILYAGGDTGDMKDTTDTVDMLVEALETQGHMVRTQEVNEQNWRRAVRTAGEVIFNLVEDETWKLYTKVGIALEQLGRAQVGHDLRSFNYEVKKVRIKRRMKALNIKTPAFRVLNRRSKTVHIRGLEYPLIVKPSGQHAGIGISQDSVVIDEQELQDRVKFLFTNFPGEVVVEEFIDGREIHVTVMGNGRHVFTLPYSELNFTGEFADNWEVYTYDAKWNEKSWEYWSVPVISPIKISRLLETRLERLAIKAFEAFNCRDIIRLDVRVDKKDAPYIVDLNMNPSLKKDELDATWMSAKALEWSYEDLIETIVGITYKRVYGKLPQVIRERHFLLSAPSV